MALHQVCNPLSSSNTGVHECLTPFSGLFPTEVRTNPSLTLDILPTGARQMVSRDKADDLGVTYIPPGTPWPLEIPAGSLGSRVDMGTLVLFLVANHYVNGETVLIDGGVSAASCLLAR